MTRSSRFTHVLRRNGRACRRVAPPGAGRLRVPARARPDAEKKPAEAAGGPPGAQLWALAAASSPRRRRLVATLYFALYLHAARPAESPVAPARSPTCGERVAGRSGGAQIVGRLQWSAWRPLAPAAACFHYPLHLSLDQSEVLRGE